MAILRKTITPVVLTGVCIALLLGCLSAALPDILAHPQQPFIHSLRNGVRNPSILSWLLVFAFGFLLGLYEDGYPVFVGLTVAAPYIGLAMSEKILDLTTHPYFVLSFLYYCVMGYVAVGGILLSKKLKEYLPVVNKQTRD